MAQNGKPIRPSSFGRRPDLAMYLSDLAEAQGMSLVTRRYLTNYAMGTMPYTELQRLALKRPDAKAALQLMEMAAGRDPGIADAVYQIELRHNVPDTAQAEQIYNDTLAQRQAPAAPQGAAAPAPAPAMPPRRDDQMAPGRAEELGTGQGVARPRGMIDRMGERLGELPGRAVDAISALPERVMSGLRDASPRPGPGGPAISRGMPVRPAAAPAENPMMNFQEDMDANSTRPDPDLAAIEAEIDGIVDEILGSMPEADAADMQGLREDMGSAPDQPQPAPPPGPAIIPSTERSDDDVPSGSAEAPVEAPSRNQAPAPARRGVMAPNEAPMPAEKPMPSRGLAAPEEEWTPDPNRYYDEDGRYVEVTDGEKRVYGFGTKEFFDSLPAKEQERVKTARDRGIMGMF